MVRDSTIWGRRTMSDARVDELVALIRSLEADAYERGKADAKREIMAYLTTNASLGPVTSGQAKTPQPPSRPIKQRVAAGRQRAPKGTTGKLISRALSSHPGLTPAQILTHAETGDEKMVQGPSLRNQLRRGRKEGRYRRTDGRWYLNAAGKDEAEGRTSQASPSASNPSQGGSYGTALDQTPDRL